MGCEDAGGCTFCTSFRILKRNGIHYLIICCQSPDMSIRMTGDSCGVYAAVLPENLDDF